MTKTEITPPLPEELSADTLDAAKPDHALEGLPKIQADPRFYRYHPRSTLSLGRNFDLRDVTEPKPPAIVAQSEWLDQGAPSTTIQAYFVRNQRELNQSAKRDIHIEGRYLSASASGGYNFNELTKFSSDSISVVLIATVDFGRQALQAGAALTAEAAQALQEDALNFARTYGTRYVAQQRRGAHLAAVVTIEALDEYTKREFTSNFQAGGGLGGFSAKAKASFNRMVESASKQSRLRIEVAAVGGDGPTNLKAILTGYAKDSADPFGDMSTKLQSALAGFTKENSAAIEYTVSTMADFGLDDTVLPPWRDAQEEQLLKLADDYMNTLKDIEVIESFETGQGPYPILFPQFMEFALYDAYTVAEVREKVETYRDAVKATHRACLGSSGFSACGFPAGRYVDGRNRNLFLSEELIERDKPPKVWFKVIAVTPGSDYNELDPIQSAIVLRNDPSARLSAVRFFEPDATAYYCWFTYGGRIVSYRWITELSDGTTNDQQGTGFGEMVIKFSEDGMGRDPRAGEEQRTLDWMASASGTHSVRRSLRFFDEANRSFDVTFFEANWTSGNGQIQSGEYRFTGVNATVTRRL